MKEKQKNIYLWDPCRETGPGPFGPGSWARPSQGIWVVGWGFGDIWGGAGI